MQRFNALLQSNEVAKHPAIAFASGAWPSADCVQRRISAVLVVRTVGNVFNHIIGGFGRITGGGGGIVR
jgi:hypothetical protein